MLWVFKDQTMALMYRYVYFLSTILVCSSNGTKRWTTLFVPY